MRTPSLCCACMATLGACDVMDVFVFAGVTSVGRVVLVIVLTAVSVPGAGVTIGAPKVME